MKAHSRRVPLAVVFAIALTIAVLLPLYVERTMTHVMFADGSGGGLLTNWVITQTDRFAAAVSQRSRWPVCVKSVSPRNVIRRNPASRHSACA